jgi:regulator of sigma E protease
MIGYGQLILALSILVLLHELGHFIPAKLFKMRVDKFYLFFNPFFSVFKVKKGETEYGLGWLPLGGYVKIAGMIDESMDKAQMELPPQPWEFRSKPAWQRLITMLGGIIVNIILAFVIFCGVFFYYGVEYLPVNSLHQGVYADPALRKIGFENGDKIIQLGKEKVGDDIALQDVSWAILMGEAKQVTVLRNNAEVVISIPNDIDTRILEKKNPVLFEAPFPFVIDSIIPDGNANKASLKKGDRVISINNQYVGSFYYGKELLGNNKGKFVDIKIDRFGTEKVVKSFVSKEGMIGVAPRGDWEGLYTTETKTYSFLQSISKGASFTVEIFGKNVSQLKLLFNPNGTKHVGSILSMKKQFGEQWHWQKFWLLTANLSLILAFFNVLPIPGLDGGHAIITFVEMVTRKKPSKRFLEITQTIGMVLLLSLMFFALGNDIYNGNY